MAPWLEVTINPSCVALPTRCLLIVETPCSMRLLGMPWWVCSLACVGAGPGNDDSYKDERTNYQQNEPAVDYNSGWTGVLTRQ